MFFSVEGIEGSGKTTLTQELANRLRRSQWSVGLLRDFADPTFRIPVEEALRRSRFFSLGFENGPRAAFLYMLYHEAAKWDRAGSAAQDVMIADRFFDSIVAYQGHFLPLPDVADVVELDRVAGSLLEKIGIPIPERTYLLDVSMEISAERFAHREGQLMTDFEFARIAEIRTSLLTMASADPRFFVIDASRPFDVVVEQVLADLNTHLTVVRPA